MKNERKKLNVLVFIYILLLILGYVYFVPDYVYVHQKIDVFPLLIVIGLSFIPSLWIPTTITRPSFFVLWVLYIMVIIPSSIIPYMSINKPFSLILIFTVVLQACFFLLTRTASTPNILLPTFKISRNTFFLFFFLTFAYLNFLLIRQFGLQLNFVSLIDVYDLRSEFKEQLGDSSSYSIRWLLYVFNPFLIAIGYLQKNKRWLLFLGFFGEFVIYSTTGFKTAFFIGLVIVVLLFLVERWDLITRLPLFILVSTVVLISFAMIIDLIFFNENSATPNIVTSLTLRRNFVVPGYLSGQYLDFFSENPKALMASNTYIGTLWQSDGNYQTTIPYIIGEHAFGKSAASANANIWADAYANFGYIGMILFSFLLFLYLKAFDSIAYKLDLKLAFTMLIGPALFFSNSSLLTALLGHGAAWMLLILYFFRSSYSKKNV